MKLKDLIPLLCVFGVFAFSWAISGPSSQYLRVKGLQYAVDNAEHSDVAEIEKHDFSPVTRTIVEQAKHVWIKVRIPAEVKTWREDVVLFTGSNEAVLSMQAFQVGPGQKVLDLGFCDVRLAAPTCQLPTLQYAFPIQLTKGDEILLKVNPGVTGIHNEFYFMRRAFFSKTTIFLVCFVGFSGGMCLLVFVISMIFRTIFKESSFQVYGLFYLAISLTVMLNRGIWDIYRPEGWIAAAPLSLPALVISLAMDLLFLVSFFNLRQNHPRFNRFFRVLLILLGALLCLNFFGATSRFAWRVFIWAGYVATTLAVVLLAYLMRKRMQWATLVASGWGLAIACNYVWLSYRSGHIEGTWFFGYYVIFARMLECLVLNIVVFQKLVNLNVNLGFAKAKAQESMVAKTLFRTLSHDLSNTTQLIQMVADVSLVDRDPERIKKNIKTILRAADSQAGIINHAKANYLVRGEHAVTLVPVDLRKSTEEIFELFRARCEVKQVEFVIDLPSESLAILAEPVSLTHQIFANLVSNALKFTPAGKRVFLQAEVVGADWVEVRVKDEGVGMPAHLRDSLFDETQKVSRSGTAEEPGVGMGLLIVRDFLAAYGALFSIQSTEGLGTEISMRFKRAPL